MIAAPRIVVAGLLAALLLVACTDDPEPRFAEPSPSPSASESTSPAVDEKEPWERKSKAGAVAFAKHWVDVFNAAQSSGDTDPLKDVSARDCQSCNGFIGQLDKLYSSGGHFEGAGWDVVLASPGPDPIARDAQVNLRIARSPERVVAADGTARRFEGGKATYSAELVWSETGWRMARLVRFV